MRHSLGLLTVMVLGVLIAACTQTGRPAPPWPGGPPGTISWGADHYPLNPVAGQPVEFCVWWISTSSSDAVAEIDYTLTIDGAIVESNTVPALVIPKDAMGGLCTTESIVASRDSSYVWDVDIRWGPAAGQWEHTYTQQVDLCWPGECGIRTRREKFW